MAKQSVLSIALSVLFVTSYVSSNTASAEDRSGVRPEVLSLPSGPGSIEGLGEGFDASAQSGAGKTSVGIVLPPGPAGFAPSLSLKYSTGSGNSVLGMGWSLPLPMISRGTDRGLPSYNTNDIFVLSGMGATGAEDLVQMADGSYRFRIEGAFVRGRQRDNGTWVFLNSSGVRFEFGTSTESVVRDPGQVENIYSWCLTSQIDPHGNVIRYEYSQDSSNKPYLVKIVYGKNQVLLTYESRPDKITSYLSRFSITSAKRLASIETKHDGALITRYSLVYEMSQSLSRLTSVARIGRDGTALPSMKYTYANFSMNNAKVIALSNAPARAIGQNAEIADVNGDALPDLLLMDSSQNGGRYSYYENLDGTRFGPAIVHSSSPSVFLSSPGVELADMDGDGAADIVAHLSNNSDGTRYFPALANGEYGQGIVVTPAPNLVVGSPDMRRLDLNHDRLTDWLAIDPSTGNATVGYNLGDGQFTPAQSLGPIDDSELLSFSGDGLRLADINGDGLTDLVAVRAFGIRVWFSKGVGAWTDGFDLSGVPNLSDGERARLKVQDITGDGLADVLLVESGQARIWENVSGTLFLPAHTITGLPELRPTTQVRLADMNGNGSSDIVWIDTSNAQPWRTLDLLSDGTPSFLVRIENGFGKVTTLRYEGIGFMRKEAQAAGVSWSKRSPIGQMLISEVTQDDSLGNVLSSEYRYADAFYDGKRRESRGFAFAQRTDIGDTSQPSLITEMRYDVGDTDEARKGLPISIERRNEAGELFDRAEHSHEVRTIGMGTLGGLGTVPLRYGFASEERTEIWEKGTSPTILLKRWQRDEYGNVTQEENFGRVDGNDFAFGDDETIAIRSYAVNESAWILNSVTSEKVQNSSGERIAESRTFYDNLPFGKVGSRGLVTKSSSWIAGDHFGVESETTYSSAGNPISIIDARGGLTSIEYDGSNTFVIGASRKVDAQTTQTWRAEYDKGLGVMTAITDSNGVVSRFVFDDLGRLLAEVMPGDSEALPTKSYRYVLSSPVSHVRSETREISGQEGVIVGYSYVDGMGRKRGSYAEAPNQKFSASGLSRYGARGLAEFSAHPFYASSADFSAQTNGRIGVSVKYDATGRAISSVEADGAIRRMSFAPLAVTTFDENDSDANNSHFDTPTTEYSDGLGRTILVREMDGNRAVDISYRYNALGNVLEAVDANGNAHSYTFDGRSRQTSVVDPNAGIWSLIYNDANDVVTRTDGVGNQVSYEYDLLGRVAAETHALAGESPIESVRYHYDACDSGTDGPESLGEFQVSRLSWVEDESGQQHFGYDSRGRQIDVLRKWNDGSEHHSFTEYDAADRPVLHGYPDKSMVAYRYDAQGLLSAIPGLVKSARYTAWGTLEEVVYENGVTDRREYDDRLRQTRMHAVSASGDVLRDLSYHFDPSSQILAITDGRLGVGADKSLSQSFVYDDRYRLVASQDSEHETTWSLDDVGKLLSVASGHSDSYLNVNPTYGGGASGPDQLTKFGTRSFTYDNAGRVLHDGLRQMRWDAKGRLAEVTKGDSAESYVYAFDGSRAEKLSESGDIRVRYISGDAEERDGKLIRYLSAFGRAIKLDKDESTPLQAATSLPAAGLMKAPAVQHIIRGYTVLVFSLLMLCAYMTWIRRAWSRGPNMTTGSDFSLWKTGLRFSTAASMLVLLSCGSGSGNSTPNYSHDGTLIEAWPDDAELTLKDHLGSGVVTVDKAAVVIHSRRYHAYGSTRSEQSADGVIGQAYHYVDNERDVTTGLGHFHARPYDYETARFLGPDPLRLFPEWAEEGKGLGNVLLGIYSYTSGNPVRYTDSLGLAPNQEGVADPWSIVAEVDFLEKKGKYSKQEILEIVSSNHADNNNRYFYTEKYKWVDVRHFAKAAALSTDSGSFITQSLGFGNEVKQWVTEWGDDYRSGFSPEDLSSNRAGAEFGAYWIAPKHSLAESLAYFLVKSNAVRPKTIEGQRLVLKLPLKDPSNKGGGGGSSNNSQSTRAQSASHPSNSEPDEM